MILINTISVHVQIYQVLLLYGIYSIVCAYLTAVKSVIRFMGIEI